MTEEEWGGCDDPYPLVKHLSRAISDRKFRLFAVACCRRVDVLLSDDDSYCKAVAVAEHFAEGEATEQQRSAARASLTGWIETSTYGRVLIDTAKAVLTQKAFDAALNTSSCASYVVYWSVCTSVGKDDTDEETADPGYAASQQERSQQVQLLHCIFGNPFRPLALDPSWLTSTVTALAHGIYDVRAFDRLPILADALQDAGCDHPDVLDHCRGPGPHARGCWVIDLILGKT